MLLDDLPLIDEHSVEVSAPPAAVWEAVRRRFTDVLPGPLGSAFRRLWGCDPAFELIESHEPDLLVAAGKHRFSRYGIVFRITPTTTGSHLSAESRAEFPGLHGRAYQLAVIGTRGHVVATRGLLRSIAVTASRHDRG
ncbi:MAG: hypothetical protein JO214_14125 [Frankiaceae bacterium]|nr:hypothetical protein [Frankiaceae bacterium]